MTANEPEPALPPDTALPTLTVPLADMAPHPKNPNQGDQAAIGGAIDSLGYVVPMVVQAPKGNRKKYRILDGEHRWRHLVQRGALTADVVVLDISDADALRVLGTLNPVARKGHDDPTKALALINELVKQTQGLDGTGYNQDDMDRIMREAQAAATAAERDLYPADEGMRRGLKQRAADYEGAAVRTLMLPLPRSQHVWLVDALATLQGELDVTTNAEVVLLLAAQALGVKAPE